MFSPICLVVFLIASAAIAAAEPDPRLARANAMLGDADGYADAVVLYREILRDDPQQDEARLWLARVLAWQGAHEESLAEYEVLAAGDSPPADLLVERAEVLSWAGRYDEAEAALQGLLAATPDDARAARGLARVYRWSGRRQQAEQAYLRALALEEDSEATRELAELREGLAWELSSDADFGADSDGFSQAWASGLAMRDLDYRTRLFVTTRWTRIAVDRDAAPAPLPLRATHHAIDALVGVRRRLGETVSTSLELGGRRWQDAPNHLLVRARLETPVPGSGVVNAAVTHGDFLERSASVDAVRAGLRDTTVRLSHWQPWPARLSGFVWAEGSFIDDGNERVASGLTLEHRLWDEREIALVLSMSSLLYTGESDLYYDPELDVAGSLALRAAQPLVGGLALDLWLEGGAGYARQDAVEGFGATGALSAGPVWRSRNGWWLSLRGRGRRSQRATVYTSYGGGLSFGREF